MQEFSARFYLKDSGKSVPVTVSLTDHILQVRGATQSDLKLDDLEVRLGGFNEDRIVILHKSTGDSFVSSDRALLDALTKSEVPVHVSKQASSVRSDLMFRPARRVSVWGVAITFVIVVIGLAYLAVDPVANYIASNIPPSIEQDMGHEVLQKYGRNHEIENTSKNAKRIKRIGDKLVDRLTNKHYQFHFYVEPSEQVNAFAIPGGNIILLSGLIDHAKVDDETACVMAHEIGHVVGRHSLRESLHNAGVFVIAQIVMSGSTANAADLLAGVVQVEGLRFSRQQEKEADLTGVRLAWEAGYNPRGLLDFMDRIEKEGNSNNTLSFVSDHPMPTERIVYLKEEIQQLEKAGTSEEEPVAPSTSSTLHENAQTSDEYMKTVKTKINTNWRPPKGKRTNTVQMTFEIARNGVISNVKVSKSSGLKAYDAAAVAAVKTASPLPPIPQSMPAPIAIEFALDYKVHGK